MGEFLPNGVDIQKSKKITDVMDDMTKFILKNHVDVLSQKPNYISDSLASMDSTFALNCVTVRYFKFLPK